MCWIYRWELLCLAFLLFMWQLPSWLWSSRASCPHKFNQILYSEVAGCLLSSSDHTDRTGRRSEASAGQVMDAGQRWDSKLESHTMSDARDLGKCWWERKSLNNAEFWVLCMFPAPSHGCYNTLPHPTAAITHCPSSVTWGSAYQNLRSDVSGSAVEWCPFVVTRGAGFFALSSF